MYAPRCGSILTNLLLNSDLEQGEDKPGRASSNLERDDTKGTGRGRGQPTNTA